MTTSNFEPHGRDRNAGMFFRHSAEDYAAARCCILNGLFPGFVMAEQAVEKLIKGFILFKEPQFKPKRGCGHDLRSLVHVLHSYYPDFSLTAYEKIIEIIQSAYDGRYPDSDVQSQAYMTAQLRDIDELYIFLADQSPITGDFRYQIGVWPYLYMAYLGLTNMPEPKWSLFDNQAAFRQISSRPIPPIVQRWKEAHDRAMKTR
jgi:HEPN domain-containing protein